MCEQMCEPASESTCESKCVHEGMSPNVSVPDCECAYQVYVRVCVCVGGREEGVPAYPAEARVCVWPSGQG